MKRNPTSFNEKKCAVCLDQRRRFVVLRNYSYVFERCSLILNAAVERVAVSFHLMFVIDGTAVATGLDY